MKWIIVYRDTATQVPTSQSYPSESAAEAARRALHDAAQYEVIPHLGVVTRATPRSTD